MIRSHRPRGHSRPDPTGGGQKVFWFLLGCTVVLALGLVLLYQAVTP